MDAEALAKKFHDTYEALAPSFDYETRDDSRKPWDEVPQKNKDLMVAVARVILRDLDRADEISAVRAYVERAADFNEQSSALDRNHWQRRLGILVTVVEDFCRAGIKGDVNPEKCQALLEDIYRVVNTNPYTGNIDEPRADIAKLTVRFTLETAIAGGLVLPGPKAPEWMPKIRPESSDDS